MIPLWFALLVPVWNFDRGEANALGGSYGTFGGEGCDIAVRKSADPRRGASGRAWRVEFANRGAGGCGIWMRLFDAQSADRRYPDMRAHPFVSLWAGPGSNLDGIEIRMADRVWLPRSDTKPAGTLARFAAVAPSGGWREVVVPYREFGLPTTDAAVLTLRVMPGASGMLLVDDICLKQTAEEPVPSSPAREPVRATRRAMWLWESGYALTNASEVAARCSELGITDLFVQVGRSIGTEWEALLATLHAARIRVHALDGDPTFAVRANHPGPLKLVERVAAFNHGNRERFDGIHLDCEPYSLFGFDSPARARILSEYVEMQQRVSAAARAKGLKYGIDLPFWFTTDSCRLELGGRTASVAAHVMPLVDDAGIMAYRSYVDGPDGIAALAASEVRLATELGKKALVGVETITGSPASIQYVAHIDEAAWRRLPADWPLFDLLDFDGYHLRSLLADGVRYAGLVRRSGKAYDRPLADAAEGLMRRLGDGWKPVTCADLAAIRQASAKEGDGPAACAGSRVQVAEAMGAKITFAGQSRRQVLAALQEIAEELEGEAGFDGTAIHSYSSYWELKTK